VHSGVRGSEPDTCHRCRVGAAAVTVGFVVAAAAIVAPGWIDARNLTVSAGRRRVERDRSVRWMRYGLDLWLFAAGALLFW